MLPDRNEERAANALKVIKQLIRKKKTKNAIPHLKRLIENYPKTKAAQEALMVEELVLYDGTFQYLPGALGACCQGTDWGSGQCVDMTEEQSQTECAGPLDTWKGVGVRCFTDPCDFCPNPFADTDRDNDVDQEDFAVFQACYTGLGGQAAASCACMDLDDDGDVDEDDFAIFQLGASGPEVPADPACDDASLGSAGDIPNPDRRVP